MIAILLEIDDIRFHWEIGDNCDNRRRISFSPFQREVSPVSMAPMTSLPSKRNATRECGSKNKDLCT